MSFLVENYTCTSHENTYEFFFFFFFLKLTPDTRPTSNFKSISEILVDQFLLSSCKVWFQDQVIFSSTVSVNHLGAESHLLFKTL